MEDKNKLILYVGFGVSFAITAAVAYYTFRAGEQSIGDEDEAQSKEEIALDL